MSGDDDACDGSEAFATLESRVERRNAYWEYHVDRYRLPDGSEGDYHYLHSRGSVMVLALDGETLLLTRQYRYLNHDWSIELPGGGVPEGATPLEAARQELAEEVGVVDAVMKPLGRFNPCKGLIDEICTAYVATVRGRQRPSPEASEQMEVLEWTVAQMDAAIARGDIWDGMTLAVWSMARARGAIPPG